MAGRVDKRDALLFSLLFPLHLVGRDVLRDTARFSCDDVRLAYEIEEGGFAVVNVPEYGYDRGAFCCMGGCFNRKGGWSYDCESIRRIMKTATHTTERPPIVAVLGH